MTAPVAEPLVLLPDILCDIALFDPILQPLSAERPVMVALCRDGDSDARVARALLPRLPERVALAGQGMGGVVAMEIARIAPERVARIALIGTYPQGETPSQAAEREPRIASARAGRMAAAADAEFPPDALAPGEARAGVQAVLHAMAARMPPEIYAAQTRVLQRRPDHQATLRRLACPALILCGAHDALAPPRRQRIAADLIRSARYVELPDAGHMPTLEAPDATLAALLDWLDVPPVD